MIKKESDLKKLMDECFKLGVTDKTMANCIECFPAKITDDFLEFFSKEVDQTYKMFLRCIYKGDKEVLMEKAIRISVIRFKGEL